MTRTPAARAALGLFVLTSVILSATPSNAQSVVQSTSPTLAELLTNIYGPNGLVVDSEAVLPDGSTHSAHFNSAFQSEFGQFNVALVRQLAALPVPSPASGFTYTFDSTTGTFTRSTQSFGPILADRFETIGRGKFAFGYSFQHFSFQRFDGMLLSHMPAVYTHDDASLGGGRADIITTQNAVDASVTQTTSFLTYGVTDRLDVSFVVPIIRTALKVTSDATIRRVGTASNVTIHFFRDLDAPDGYGSQRRFMSEGSAAGVGDIVLRAKGTVLKSARAGLALGLETRLPSGQEQNLLGSGAFGAKVFGAVSVSYGKISPHVNAGYQWNGSTVLAGNVATGTKGALPGELSYDVGADIGVDRRLSLAFEFLGRHSTDAPRLNSTTFATQENPPTFYPDILFRAGSLNVLTGAAGLKLNIAQTLLLTVNMQFDVNDAGLRTRVTPLIGVEYGF